MVKCTKRQIRQLKGAPFGRHPFEEGSLDASVQLVHVHRIEPAL